MNFESLDKIRQFFGGLGCKRLLVKELAPNDNSKNQIYLGSDFSVLNLLPFSEVVTEQDAVAGSKRERLKAEVQFAWAANELSYNPVNLIMYPRYPEVRISGMLKARTASETVTKLIKSRDHGRVLFLGVTPENRVVGHCAGSSEIITTEFRNRIDQNITNQVGVFHLLSVKYENRDPLDVIVSALKPIVNREWIRSRRLNSSGMELKCEAPNCGGYTLEALLGIVPNGLSEPDYEGWEIKQYGVPNFSSKASKAITLMTPEPDGGIYKDKGVVHFVHEYGYKDRKIIDRLNFGGVHRSGHVHQKTGLKLHLAGYSVSSPNKWDPKGAICLVDDREQVAASWAFSGLLEHWNRKHAQAVYVRSMVEKTPEWSYNFSNRIQLGINTSFNRFLASLACGDIYYDPGIKIEEASSGKRKIKRRSQFRVKSSNLDGLYSSFQEKVI